MHVVHTHLAVLSGSELKYVCLLVFDQAQLVSIGTHGRGIFAQLSTGQNPKPDKAIKAFARSVKVRLSHCPCGTHESSEGDLPPTDLFLLLAWRSACRDLTCGRPAWQAGSKQERFINFHFTQNIQVRQQWRWACNLCFCATHNMGGLATLHTNHQQHTNTMSTANHSVSKYRNQAQRL